MAKNNNKFDRRNSNNGQNNQQQQNNQKPVEAPQTTDVATLEDVNNDIEMMSQEEANAYYMTYEDMETTHAEMSRCKVPTVYISKMMADALDLMEVVETEGGLIRTQTDVIAEITKMDEVAALANQMFGLNINLTIDDTPQAKHYRSLYEFKEDDPTNMAQAGRLVNIPKKNEEALDLIFQEWAALSLTGYNALYTNDKGESSWTYAGIYDNVDSMYPVTEAEA